MYPTAFQLKTLTGRVIRTARFHEFDNKDPAKGRLKAKNYIEAQKSGWENIAHSIGRPDLYDLKIEEVAV